MSCKRKTLWALLGIFLFLFFWISLMLAAQGKAFWMDESDGWHSDGKMSIKQLLLTGAPAGQASRSPLPHLVDRAMLSLANDTPQKYWDLRLYYRIPPTFFWALANTFLFFFLRRRFKELLPQNPWTTNSLAAYVCFFVFSNSFSAYYAIEARAYSLWTSLTILHTCLLWDLIRKKKEKSIYISFLLTSMLLVLTTYASILQIALACALLILQEGLEEKNWLSWSQTKKRILQIALSCAAITLFYYGQTKKLPYPPAPFSLYISSVLEVILKTFRHHGVQPAYFSFPLIFILTPFFWWKRNQNTALMCLYAIASVAITFLHHLASIAAGGIYASRYAAFLVPSLSFLYLAGISMALLWLTNLLKNRFNKDFLSPILLLFSLVNLIPWVYAYSKGIPKDLLRFKERNSYQLNSDPRCSGPIEHDPEPLEKLNDFCRK